MCGRFTLTVTIGLSERFGVAACDLPLLPRYNIAPSQPVPVIIHPSGNRRTCEEMTWGLIPPAARDPGSGLRPINARAESLHERPLFRQLLTSRRCLVPATGFYEWVQTGRGSVPFYITRKDGDFFAFAGLYDIAKSPGGGFLKSFAIITTRPNPLVARYHSRMPAILLPGHESCWVERAPLPATEMAEVLSPYPEVLLTAFQVSLAVNDPGREDASLVRKVQQDILSPEDQSFRM